MLLKASMVGILALSTPGNPQDEPAAQSQNEPPVKMSRSGICHAKGSVFYKRTKRFEAFQSVRACLEAGGRRPNR